MSLDYSARSQERSATMDPADAGAALAARIARIRLGQEPYPEHAPSYVVLDPLHVARLRKAVDTLNKRATRKGAFPLALLESERTWQDMPTGRTLAVRRVTILGEVPDLGDWRWVARLEHTPSGNVLHRVQDWRPLPSHLAALPPDTLESYRMRGPQCDHCDTRRARNETYVVRNMTTGQTVQVGRSCLESYTGSDPLAALSALDAFATLAEEARATSELHDDPHAMPGYQTWAIVAAAIAQPTRLAYACWDAAPRYLRPETELTPDDRDAMESARDRVASALIVTGRHLEGERLAALAGGTWPEGFERLPERWHNLAVILAEGFAPREHAGTVVSVLRFLDEREADARAARERAEALDPAACMRRFQEAMQVVGVVTGGIEARTLARVLVMTPADLAPLVRAARALAVAEGSVSADPIEPAPVGTALAAQGTRGTWRATVHTVRRFHTHGGGWVVGMEHACQDGRRRFSVVFYKGGPLPAGVVEGGTVRVTGTVQGTSWSRFRGADETTLNDSPTFEAV